MAKVYKVVRVIDDKLYSVLVDARTLRLRYWPGKITRPKIGVVMCFRRKKDAEAFKASLPTEGSFQIWSGYAEMSRSILFLARYQSDIKWFWGAGKRKTSTRFGELITTPNGTVGVPSLRLISRVQ
jgi:hypothetical protein